MIPNTCKLFNNKNYTFAPKHTTAKNGVIAPQFLENNITSPVSKSFGKIKLLISLDLIY